AWMKSATTVGVASGATVAADTVSAAVIGPSVAALAGALAAGLTVRDILCPAGDDRRRSCGTTAASAMTGRSQRPTTCIEVVAAGRGAISARAVAVPPEA